MKKRQIVLVGEHHLWGESLEYLLTNISDVELMGWWEFDENLLQRLKDQSPDILLIADDEPLSGDFTCITAEIIETLPDLTVLQVKPSKNELRLFTSQTLPARQSELLNIIRNLQTLDPSADRDETSKEEKL